MSNVRHKFDLGLVVNQAQLMNTVRLATWRLPTPQIHA